MNFKAGDIQFQMADILQSEVLCRSFALPIAALYQTKPMQMSCSTLPLD